MRLMNRDSEAVDLERVLCSITVRLTFIQLLIICVHFFTLEMEKKIFQIERRKQVILCKVQ